MHIDNYGRTILDPSEVFDALYSGKISSVQDLYLTNNDLVTQYNQAIYENADKISELRFIESDPFSSVELFDEANQCDWFMPSTYMEFPITDWLYAQCETEQQKTRVDEELTLFIQHGMFDLLFYLKYLVDTMRENNVVWGVGRGSSVASYVLFLLGIHKIDSIKYNLDIKEFLK